MREASAVSGAHQFNGGPTWSKEEICGGAGGGGGGGWRAAVCGSDDREELGPSGDQLRRGGRVTGVFGRGERDGCPGGAGWSLERGAAREEDGVVCKEAARDGDSGPGALRLGCWRWEEVGDSCGSSSRARLACGGGSGSGGGNGADMSELGGEVRNRSASSVGHKTIQHKNEYTDEIQKTIVCRC